MPSTRRSGGAPQLPCPGRSAAIVGADFVRQPIDRVVEKSATAVVRTRKSLAPGNPELIIDRGMPEKVWLA